GRSDTNASSKGRCRCIEAGQQRAVLAAGNGHLRPTALVGGGDDVGESVAIDVAGRSEDAARKLHRQGHEVANHLEGFSIEDEYLGPASGPRTADDVRGAVAVDIA